MRESPHWEEVSVPRVRKIDRMAFLVSAVGVAMAGTLAVQTLPADQRELIESAVCAQLSDLARREPEAFCGGHAFASIVGGWAGGRFGQASTESAMSFAWEEAASARARALAVSRAY